MTIELIKTQLLTAVVLVFLAAPALAAHPGGTAYADVNGLVCDFCARALEKVFGRQEAVGTIAVDLDTKIITIHFREGQSLDDDTIASLITYAGYNVKEIRRENTHGE